jgi:peptide/nickel transport system substrate-binding protein
MFRFPRVSSAERSPELTPAQRTPTTHSARLQPGQRSAERSARPRPTLRSALAGVALVAAAALVLTGCASATNASSTGAIQKGGTLNLAFNADAYPNLDPNQNFWIESRSIDRNLVDSLTDQDPKTGKILPWLATSWTVSADAKKYTFELRKDVTFSDGEKFDATAVKTAFDGIIKLGPAATLGATYLSGYADTKVLSDSSVQVDFSTPNAAFLQATATTTLGILSPKSYENTPADRALGKFWGSGPFVLDKYVPQQSVVASARKDYSWGSSINTNTGAAHISKLNVTFIPEESVLVGSLTSGQIDVAWPRNPLTDADQQLIKAGGGAISSAVLPGLTYNLQANVTGILADPVIRTAVQQSIDRETWANTVFYKGYEAAKSVIDSSTPQWADQSDLLKFDPKAAEASLDAAGWTVGEGGYRYKNGKKLTLVSLEAAPWSGWDLVQSQLKAVGIDFEQKVVTAAQFSPLSAAGKWDLTATYFTRGDADILRTYYDTTVVKKGVAAGAYTQDAATGAKLSALFAKEISEPDATKRDALFAEIQSELISSGALFPLQNRVQVVGTSSSVHGLKFTLESFLRLNDVWLSK